MSGRHVSARPCLQTPGVAAGLTNHRGGGVAVRANHGEHSLGAGAILSTAAPFSGPRRCRRHSVASGTGYVGEAGLCHLALG